MRVILRGLTLSVAIALPTGAAFSADDMAEIHHASESFSSARLGSVSFKSSCQSQVKADLNRGVALLHSFWLDEAERVFNEVAKADPDCAMAYWGIAMSHSNQVNGGPATSDLMPAKEALAKAESAHEKNSREADYIGAVRHLFDDYQEDNLYTSAKHYTEAMANVAAKYPSDLEAQIFYALALLHSSRPDDETLANPKKAVAILSPLLRKYPNHPGIAHYIIHACDNPKMAAQGVEAARRYASIAPSAPHALHMPSHIFARLGNWQDDIRSNLASKAAAEDPRNIAGRHNVFHAMEFLEYAYLQIGQFEQAESIVTDARKIKAADLEARYANYYSTVETRFAVLFAIETQNWGMAMTIEPVDSTSMTSQGLALLAHAIAAGHLHDSNAGTKAAQEIESLLEKYPIWQFGARGYGPDEIRAWAKLSQGDAEGAIALLRPIADRQAQVGKGEVELPAREMLADMLLLSESYAEALTEYERSLVSDPNRFNALFGAGQAAERLGQQKLAAHYYSMLLANSVGANGKAQEILAHARTINRF